MTDTSSPGKITAGLVLLVAAPLAMPPVVRELLYSFQTVAGMRGLVCLLEFGLIGAWLFRHPRPVMWQPTRPVALLLLVWAVLATASVMFAQYPVPALVRHAEWAGHMLFALSLWHSLAERDGLPGVVFASVVTGFLVVTAGLIAHWGAFPDPVAYDWALELPFFDHVRHYGYLALAALILSGFWIANPRADSWRAAVALVALITAMSALIWAGGRGAVLGAIIGLSTLVALSRGAGRWRLVGAVCLAVIPAAWLASHFRVDIPIMGIDRLLGRAVEYGGLNDFSTGRTEVWQYTLAAIADHPFLGLGPDGFAYLSPPVMRLPVQPHSMPLQLVSDWGLPAALVFFALVLIAGLQWWRRSNEADTDATDHTARVTAGALIVAYLAHSLVDGPFYHALPMAIAAACAAIAVGPVARRSNRDTGLGVTAGRARRAVAAAIAAGVLVVMVLHVAVVVTVTRDETPAPDGWRARLVLAFPSRINQQTLRPWLSTWESDDPQRALALARWAQRHARHPWWYYYYEATRLADTEPALAARAFGAAIHHAPGTEEARLRAEYRRLFGDPPVPDRR